jgi:tRNA pseudouridine55 synthase
MNGIIKVDKPSGPTSHDVVNRVRQITGTKRVGHSGTLDPFATGLLLVGVGNGTRILEYLSGMDKVYDVVLKLGITTDTFDRTGKVIDEMNCDKSEDEAIEIVSSFVGEYDQVPPMYSAKRYKGVRLYELARAGKIITMPPKRVKIHSIKIKEINLPFVKFIVNVSEGTYIRSLCSDIGTKIGCGAITYDLRRIKVGPFDLASSSDIYEINSSTDLHLMSIEEITEPLFSTVIVNGSGLNKVMNGQSLIAEDLEIYEDFEKGEIVRVLDTGGKFIALYFSERRSKFISTLKENELERKDIVLRSKKVFNN